MTVRASLFNAALESLADRTACLVPDVQVFTVTGAWVKPAFALLVQVQGITAGQPGGNVNIALHGSGGGGGGRSGTYFDFTLPASLVPATATATVQTTYGTGTESGLISSANQFLCGVSSLPTDLIAVPTTTAGATGGVVITYVPGYHSGSSGGAGGTGNTSGGAGGASSAGGRNMSGAAGNGRDGVGAGYSGLHGFGGYGYGAGGGGCGGYGTAADTPDSAGGSGGGGGGGIGYTKLSTDGGEDGIYGGSGAPGIVIVTTWRGLAV